MASRDLSVGHDQGLDFVDADGDGAGAIDCILHRLGFSPFFFFLLLFLLLLGRSLARLCSGLVSVFLITVFWTTLLLLSYLCVA